MELGVSGFTNPSKKERYVYYDFLCTAFEGQVRGNAHEGEQKWWKISELDQIDMQDDIRERLPLPSTGGKALSSGFITGMRKNTVRGNQDDFV